MSETEPSKSYEPQASTANKKDYSQRSNPALLCFRSFIVIPKARRLVCNGLEIPLGGRAFDLLVVLLQARGCVVTKDAIMRAVWPSISVDDSNLRFQMALLRKALGEHRDAIKTIAGRGYTLVDDFMPLGPEAVSDNEQDLLLSDRASIAYEMGFDPVSRLGGSSLTKRIVQLEAENSRLRLAVVHLSIDRKSHAAVSVF